MTLESQSPKIFGQGLAALGQKGTEWAEWCIQEADSVDEGGKVKASREAVRMESYQRDGKAFDPRLSLTPRVSRGSVSRPTLTLTSVAFMSHPPEGG